MTINCAHIIIMNNECIYGHWRIRKKRAAQNQGKVRNGKTGNSRPWLLKLSNSGEWLASLSRSSSRMHGPIKTEKIASCSVDLQAAGCSFHLQGRAIHIRSRYQGYLRGKEKKRGLLDTSPTEHFSIWAPILVNMLIDDIKKNRQFDALIFIKCSARIYEVVFFYSREDGL